MPDFFGLIRGGLLKGKIVDFSGDKDLVFDNGTWREVVEEDNFTVGMLTDSMPLTADEVADLTSGVIPSQKELQSF